VASDLTVAGGNAVTVDWLGRGPLPSTGDYLSPVHDAGDSRVVWGTLTAAADTPSGTALTIQTRSGNSATPDASWSAYQSLGAGGAIQSPSARYIQYKATLSTATEHVTPSLNRVDITYDIDTIGPRVAIDGVQASGTTANVAFSSPDLDIVRFECGLDGGAFATCTSPTVLAGLAAGSHTVSVRGIDRVGNVGDIVASLFNVASPSSGGGSSLVADKTAPKVSLVAKSLRASKSGTVSFRVGCPATEQSCKIKLQLKKAGKSVASKTVTVKGGKTVTLTLQLNKATRALLKHASVKVSAVMTATDAAGNRRTTTRKLTLRRPA
jgi:hypothetical protein